MRDADDKGLERWKQLDMPDSEVMRIRAAMKSDQGRGGSLLGQ